MTFLAQMTSKSLLKLQKSHLSYQLSLNINQINYVRRQMEEKENEYDEAGMSGSELSNDLYYKSLQRESERIERRQESINEQISLLEQEISSFESLMKNGIKDSCSMPLLGGS